MTLLTKLLRLRHGNILHRDAHHPAEWDRAVTLTNLMPHLEVTEFMITPKFNCPNAEIITANEGREIDFPDGGTHTLNQIWEAQMKPRPKIETLELHLRLLAKHFPQLVRKRHKERIILWSFK